MIPLPPNLPDFEPGTVWLAGAGPGDPGLLTAHALNALGQAEVIVYDALVSPEILSLASPDAEFIDAGKRGGRASANQDDIILTLIDQARRGKRVLRLKGGDPFIFGRGGEEALGLKAAGIRFRILPGITAGIGGLGYAGIPPTHRGVNTAVTFVTGQDRHGNVNHVDWSALAKASPVIVLYMSLNRLGDICAKLRAAGRDGDEPVAVISRATTPHQRTLVTTLSQCEQAVRDAAVEAPAIIVIGPVAALAPELDWWQPGEVGGETGG